MNYQAKLNSLCKQNHAEIVPDAAGSGGAWSDSTTGELHIPPTLTNEDTFWTALHELGHIVHDDSTAKQKWYEQHGPRGLEEMLFGPSIDDSFPLPDLQKQEALATTWALDHGGFDPSPQAAANLLFSLHTYNTFDPKTGVGDPRAPITPPAEYTACEKRLEALAKGVKTTMTNERVRDEANGSAGR